jgi:molybdopterin converting factor small subunit
VIGMDREVIENAISDVFVYLMKERTVERVEEELLKQNGYSRKKPENLEDALEQVRTVSEIEKKYVEQHGEEELRKLYNRILKEEVQKFLKKLEEEVLKNAGF